MKKIIFMTSGKIKYQLPGVSLYDSIATTARGEAYPHLDQTGLNDIRDASNSMSNEVDFIYYAPSFQCTETANFFAKPAKSLDFLLPLKFDLRNIIEPEEFKSLGAGSFDVLRQRYLKAFFENKLLENNREITNRFTSLVDICPPNSTTLVISHAYLIMQFFAYFLLGESIYLSYKKLSQVFRPQFETMSRLQTVKIIIN